jgi:hypothetical protein
MQIINLASQRIKRKLEADEKWRKNGNLDVVNRKRIMITILMIIGIVSLPLAFFHVFGIDIMWMIIALLCYIATAQVYHDFEELVEIRKENERKREAQ